MNNFFVQMKSNFYLVMGKIDSAKDILYTAVRSEPENLTLLNKLKDIYYYEGKKDEFISVLKEMDVLKPDSYRLKWNIGSYLILFSKFDDAIYYFKSCIKNLPLNLHDYAKANIHARLGCCYNLVGESSNAEKELAYAESIAPWDGDMCFGFIQYFRTTNSHEKILGFLDNKIATYPYFYALYYWKADYIAHYCYDLDEAMKWYRMSVRFLWKGHYNYYSPLYLSINGNAFPENIIEDYFDALIKTGKEHEAWKEILLSKLFLWTKIDLDIFKIKYLILKKMLDRKSVV